MAAALAVRRERAEVNEADCVSRCSLVRSLSLSLSLPLSAEPIRRARAVHTAERLFSTTRNTPKKRAGKLNPYRYPLRAYTVTDTYSLLRRLRRRSHRIQATLTEACVFLYMPTKRSPKKPFSLGSYHCSITNSAD